MIGPDGSSGIGVLQAAPGVLSRQSQVEVSTDGDVRIAQNEEESLMGVQTNEGGPKNVGQQGCGSDPSLGNASVKNLASDVALFRASDPDIANTDLQQDAGESWDMLNAADCSAANVLCPNSEGIAEGIHKKFEAAASELDVSRDDSPVFGESVAGRRHRGDEETQSRRDDEETQSCRGRQSSRGQRGKRSQTPFSRRRSDLANVEDGDNSCTLSTNRVLVKIENQPGSVNGDMSSRPSGKCQVQFADEKEMEICITNDDSTKDVSRTGKRVTFANQSAHSGSENAISCEERRGRRPSEQDAENYKDIPRRGREASTSGKPRRRSQTPFCKKRFSIQDPEKDDATDADHGSKTTEDWEVDEPTELILKCSEGTEQRKVRFGTNEVFGTVEHAETPRQSRLARKEDVENGIRCNAEGSVSHLFNDNSSEGDCEQETFSRRVMSYFTSDDEDTRMEREEARSKRHIASSTPSSLLGDQAHLQSRAEEAGVLGTAEWGASAGTSAQTLGRGRTLRTTQKIRKRDKTPFSRRSLHICEPDEEASWSSTTALSSTTTNSVAGEDVEDALKSSGHRVRFSDNADCTPKAPACKTIHRGRQRTVGRESRKRDQTPFNRARFVADCWDGDEDTAAGREKGSQGVDEEASTARDRDDEPRVQVVSSRSLDAAPKALNTTRKARGRALKPSRIISRRGPAPFHERTLNASDPNQIEDDNSTFSDDVEFPVRGAISRVPPTFATAEVRKSHGAGEQKKRGIEKGTQVSLGSWASDEITDTAVAHNMAAIEVQRSSTGCPGYGNALKINWGPIALWTATSLMIVGLAKCSE